MAANTATLRPHLANAITEFLSEIHHAVTTAAHCPVTIITSAATGKNVRVVMAN